MWRSAKEIWGTVVSKSISAHYSFNCYIFWESFNWCLGWKEMRNPLLSLWVWPLFNLDSYIDAKVLKWKIPQVVMIIVSQQNTSYNDRSAFDFKMITVSLREAEVWMVIKNSAETMPVFPFLITSGAKCFQSNTMY